MFERYTESARRSLFFARYDCSMLGSLTIEPEHILLGLVREGRGLVATILRSSRVEMEDVRDEVQKLLPFREKVATSVEIPFSDGTKRVLKYSAEEADRLLHSYIGTEHMLLGILREDRSGAASILAKHGLHLAGVREQIVKLLGEAANVPSENLPTTLDGHALLDSIKRLVDRIRERPLDALEAAELTARIQRELDALRRFLR